ncbi:MAG: hypothetical protein ABI810_18335 [Sphingomonas bacterium]
MAGALFHMTGKFRTAVRAITGAVPPLLSPTFTAVPPLLFHNSEMPLKPLETNQEFTAECRHNSGRKNNAGEQRVTAVKRR